MGFSFNFALKNIRRRPFRSVSLAVIVLFLSFTLFVGAYTIISLQNGLGSYRARLGADIVVVPNSAKGHGSVDDILLQGITGTYYMSGKDGAKIASTSGVQAASKQFFLTSAKASCCSSRVQIIGFDPKTDFSVMPWIGESYSGEIGDGDVVVGAEVTVPDNRLLKFYGENYHVAAVLEKTGTGLDTAVYATMNTVRQMAEDASNLLDTAPYKGVDPQQAASAVLIKVEDGYSPEEVADDINIHITKVQATPARSMVAKISGGLEGVSKIIGALVGIIWVLAVAVLLIVFAMLTNERRKEFAVLRVMGASQKMLFSVMWIESLVISLIGAAAGLACGAAVAIPLGTTLKGALELPFLSPNPGVMSVLCAAALLISAGAGAVVALISAARITGSETALLIREDA